MGLKKKTLAALAVTAVGLAGASSASASTGKSCLVNSGAVTCAAPYTGTLYAGDTATNATLTTPIGTITCTVATGNGTITSSGASAGPGPKGNLAAVAFTNAAGAPCASTILGGLPAVVTALDNNGAGAGLWDVEGDWNAGNPLMSFSPKVQITLGTGGGALNCVYAVNAAPNQVTGQLNNAASTLTFSAATNPATANRTLQRQVGSPAACPASGTFAASFGPLKTAAGGAGSNVYITS